MGGPSAEREISLISGKAVLAALRSKGVDAHAFDPAERELFDLRREGFKCCFIALHGRFGEDGTVQGALEVMRIPYTGSGVMGSALSMDKWRTKLVWNAAGIPTPRFAMVGDTTDWEKVTEHLGMPVIVKPAREGSTLGLSKVSTPADFHAAWQLAAKYDDLVVAEEFIAGVELTASIISEAERGPALAGSAPRRQNASYWQTLHRRHECLAATLGVQDEIAGGGRASAAWVVADVGARTRCCIDALNFPKMNTARHDAAGPCPARPLRASPTCA
jgi:D-alanine--D-alanine ligase